MRDLPLCLPLFLLLPAACGGDDDGTAADAAPLADGQPDAYTPPDCTQPVTGTTFTLATPPGRSASHPRFYFDGKLLWVVYTSAPEQGSNQGATWMTRVGCDGGTASGPLLLSSTPTLNVVSPEIAHNGDDTLVAWVADDGNVESIMNLQLYTLPLDAQGQPLGTPSKLVTTQGGVTLTQNNWMPSLAPVRGGSGFWLAGSRVLPLPIDRFNAYVQRLDAQGAPVGDAIDLDPRQGSGSFEPSLVSLDDGSLGVAWQRVPDAEGTTNFIELGTVDANGTVGPTVRPEPLPVEGGLDAWSDYSTAASAGNRAYFGWHGGPDDHDSGTSEDLDVYLSRPGQATPTRIMGGTYDAAATLAAHPTAGAAVAWIRFNVRRIMVASITDGETGLVLGASKTIASDLDAGGDVPALIHVKDDVWALGWIEYENERYEIRLQFLEL